MLPKARFFANMFDNEHLWALTKVNEGSMETKDLIVIGGGINGAGIAADAAGRGLSVLMLEA